MPIDINKLRTDKGKDILPNISHTGGDPEVIKKSQRDRYKDDKLIDDIIEID